MDRGDSGSLIGAGTNPPASTGARTTARLAALGIAAAAIDLGSVYLKFHAGPRGVTLGDWIAGLGAYLLLGLYAWVAAGLGPRRGPEAGLFFAAVVTYAFGCGIHLAANSIHDMLDKTGVGDPWRLAYFWDETAGHYLVDAARIAFAVALVWTEGNAGGTETPGRRFPMIVGATSYGFIYFATAVEGQTVPLALPYSILFLIWGLWRGRAERGARAHPVRGFYLSASVVSLALFAVWGIWHHGFPEFSGTGFIPTATRS